MDNYGAISQRGFLSKRRGGTISGDTLYTPAGAINQNDEIVNKAYVDATVIGLSASDQYANVVAASAAALSACTAAGAGVGKTLTVDAAEVLVVDGYTPVLNDRILVKNQVATKDNGIYKLTTLGTALIAWVLTRATDMDATAEVTTANWVFIDNGTVNHDAGYKVDAAPTTLDTDPLTFAVFSGAVTAAYVIAADAVVSAAKVTKAGDTMTGNLAISNAAPRLTLKDTDSSPANQELYLYKDGNESGLVGQIPMATNLGNQALFGQNFAATAALPTLGTTFAIMAVAKQPDNIAAVLGYSKDYAGTKIVHGVALYHTNDLLQLRLSSEVGGVQKSAASINAPSGVGETSEFVSLIALFDSVADTVKYSVNGEPFVTATVTTAGGGTFTVPWAAEKFAIATVDGATKEGNGAECFADIVLFNGSLSDADAAWYYNGGAFQSSANIEARVWDAAANTLTVLGGFHWNCDEADGTHSALIESIVGGGTNDLTTDSGTFTSSLVPTTGVLDAIPVSVTASAQAGYRGKTMLGERFGETFHQGREITAAPYDAAAGVDVEVQQITANGIYVSSSFAGTATANGTTEVTVNNAKVTANSRITLNAQTPNAGTPGALYVSSRVAGTSFGFKSTSAADASTVAWSITEPI